MCSKSKTRDSPQNITSPSTLEAAAKKFNFASRIKGVRLQVYDADVKLFRVVNKVEI